MSPGQRARERMARFNPGDVGDLEALYAERAVNHQWVRAPLHGRAAIRHLVEVESVRATMTCLVENLLGRHPNTGQEP